MAVMHTKAIRAIIITYSTNEAARSLRARRRTPGGEWLRVTFIGSPFVLRPATGGDAGRPSEHRHRATGTLSGNPSSRDRHQPVVVPVDDLPAGVLLDQLVQLGLVVPEHGGGLPALEHLLPALLAV